jgi:protein involved in polysaccharide export with SLBB domain
MVILMIVLGIVSLPDINTAAGIQTPESSVLELADRSTYVLGPGDIVCVVVEGGSSQALMSTGVSPWTEIAVGGDGFLSVSGIGAVSLDGLTIDEAQQALQMKTSAYYPSLRVSLSLIKPRMLRVDVGGMVDMPGTYILNALDRASDAVMMAGGISSFGSRRGKLLTDEGDTIQIDLNIVPGSVSYVSDPFLTNNAGIIIDVCENPVFLLYTANALETRDLQPHENFETLLSRMGGVTGNISLLDCRIKREGAMLPVWDLENGFIDTGLIPGDTILIVSIRDSVTVGGAVVYPGSVPYNPESTVLDYIVTAGGPVSTASGSYTIRRNGIELEIDGDKRDAHLLPGDIVNVNYNWFNRNAAMISLITSVVSIGLTVYALNN